MPGLVPALVPQRIRLFVLSGSRELGQAVAVREEAAFENAFRRRRTVVLSAAPLLACVTHGLFRPGSREALADPAIASGSSSMAPGQAGVAVPDMASALMQEMPRSRSTSRVTRAEPSMSMARQASSITTTSKPARRASSAE